MVRTTRSSSSSSSTPRRRRQRTRSPERAPLASSSLARRSERSRLRKRDASSSSPPCRSQRTSPSKSPKKVSSCQPRRSQQPRSSKSTSPRRKSVSTKRPSRKRIRSSFPPERQEKRIRKESDSSHSNSNSLKRIQSETNNSCGDPSKKTSSNYHSSNVIKAIVTDSDGTVSCSVEETNRIRALLGLKPLNISSPDSSSTTNDVMNIDSNDTAAWVLQEKHLQIVKDEKKALVLETKLARLRRRREYYAQLEGKGLGDVSTGDEEEKDSTTSWVAHSRTLEKKKHNINISKKTKSFEEKERLLQAIRTAQRFAEADERARVYTAADLAGVQIRHDISDFANGTTILTLQDTSILDENDEASGVVLENVNLRDDRRATFLKKRRDRSSKPIYVGNDDDEFDMNRNNNIALRGMDRETLRKKKMLQQYNDDEKEEEERIGQMILDGRETISANSLQNEMTKNVREKALFALKQGESLDTLSDLDKRKKELESYYTAAEIDRKVAFKKKKKKRRKKKRSFKEEEKSVADILEESIIPETSTSASKDEKSTLSAKQKRTKGYKNAVPKAPKKNEREEVKNDFLSYNNDDAFLVASVARARRLGQKQGRGREKLPKKNMDIHAKQIASRIAELSKFDEKCSNGKEKISLSKLVLNSTAEFSRRLQAQVEEADHKRKTNVENVDTSTSVEMKKEKEEKEEQSKKEDFSKLSNSFGRENETSSSTMSSLLTLLRRRGDLNAKEKVSGRKTDSSKITSVSIPSMTGGKIKLEYRDTAGRLLTRKEAFRQLSYKFHGQKPGRKKQEKRILQLEQEKQRQQMSVDDTPLNIVSKMRQKQEATGQSFLVIDKF
eukprot:g3810.t1